jgi:polyferredoxin
LSVQIVFFLLNIWIAVQFWMFVRGFEVPNAPRVSRPPGVEGWLPIAGLMNLKYFLTTGKAPAVHPAAMVLLSTFLLSSLLFRKAFCSWLCPVGTLSEWLWKAGRSTFGRNFQLPRWLDIGLRSLKYVLLGLFAYAVGSMAAPALAAFLESPYGLVADVKMLNFFRYMSVTAAVTLGLLALASIFVQNFWCRYLCPYGALMGLASLLSPLRIRRRVETCIDCAKCAKACPALLPVDKLVQIRSAECLGCMECVTSCPVADTLHLAPPSRRPFPAWAVAAGLAVLFFGIVGAARLTGHWHSPISDFEYRELIPRVAEFTHP